MTEAMPFLRKLILLSYDPRPFQGGIFAAQKAGFRQGAGPYSSAQPPARSTAFFHPARRRSRSSPAISGW